MASYYIVGTAYIRKWLDEETNEWDSEQFSINVEADTPHANEDEDFRHALGAYDDWEIIELKEQGMFIVQAAIKVSWYRTYENEVDADYEILWSNVTKLTASEEATVYACNGLNDQETLAQPEEKVVAVLSEFM